MKHPIATLAALAALIAPATAQQFPLTLPANTVYGRLGASSGPGQAIPFATLRDRLAGTPAAGLFTSLGVTGQSYFGPIAAGGDKRVAISGAFSKVTATGNQNLTLISGDAFANTPLTMSMQVIGSATGNLRQGEIQVGEYGLSTYRTLALQPLGGSVSIGLPSGTLPTALLDVRGTGQFADPAFIPLLPANLWGQSLVQMGAVYSSTKQAVLTLQQVVPVLGVGYPAYEAAALFIEVRTHDPAGGLEKGVTPADFRASISSDNPDGEVWAFFNQAIVETGGDGVAFGQETSVLNNGTSQPSVFTATSKYNVNLTTAGNPTTAGILFSNSGPGWHKGIYMQPASLTGATGSQFIELAGKFTVGKTGFTAIAGTTLTAHPLAVQAEAGGGFAIAIQGRASDGIGRLNWYSNDLLTVYASLTSSSSTELVSSSTFKPGDDGVRNNGGSANAWLGVYTRNLFLNGSTSGALTVKAPAIAGATTLTLPAGTTDFSATGGTSQVVKQTSAGGALTVARLACSDLSDSSTGCGAASGITALTGDVTATGPGSAAATIANNVVTLAKLATQATNTVLANVTPGTAVPTAHAMTSCSAAASAVKYTTDTGFGCNTSITAATLSAVLGPALGGTGVANNAASTITVSGSFGLTFTIAAAVNATLPGTGTLSRMQSKVITSTRDMTAASGNVAYTGAGFTPTSCHANASVGGGSNVRTSHSGFADSAKTGKAVYIVNALFNMTSNLIALIETDGTTGQVATVNSYDADGFTLAWVKTGAPGAGSATLNFLCYGN